MLSVQQGLKDEGVSVPMVIPPLLAVAKSGTRPPMPVSALA